MVVFRAGKRRVRREERGWERSRAPHSLASCTLMAETMLLVLLNTGFGSCVKCRRRLKRSSV